MKSAIRKRQSLKARTPSTSQELMQNHFSPETAQVDSPASSSLSTLTRAFDAGCLNGAQRVSFVRQVGQTMGNRQVQRMLTSQAAAAATRSHPKTGPSPLQRACGCDSEAKNAPEAETRSPEEGTTVARACECSGAGASGKPKEDEAQAQRAPAAPTPTAEAAKAEFDALFAAVDAFLAEQPQGASSSLAAAPGADGLVGEGEAAGTLKREGDKLVDRSTPDWLVSYKPQALLKPLGGAGPTQQANFLTDPNHDSFNIVRGTNGILSISTDIHWERTSKNGSKGGSGPSGGLTGILGTLCDIGKIGTLIIPGIGKIVQAICAAGDPKKRAEIIDKLTNAEMCALVAAIGAIVGVGIGGLIGGAACALIIPFIGDTIRDKLKSLLGATPDNIKPPVPPTPIIVTDKGDARAFLETRFIFTADGQMQLVGTPPTGQSHGKAGEMASPVQFSRDTTSLGALISLVPLIHSSINSTRANGETISDNNDFQQSFAIDLNIPPPPAAVKFCCTKQLFPFVIAKERFQQEDVKQQELFDWFRSLSPQVQKSVQDKQTKVIVIGRASNTGSKEFNLGLAERRAKHVAQMMNDFGGSLAVVDTFAFGRLTAVAAGEAGFERRAEVIIKGEIPGTDPATDATLVPCGTNVPDEGGVCADPAAR